MYTVSHLIKHTVCDQYVFVIRFLSAAADTYLFVCRLMDLSAGGKYYRSNSCKLDDEIHDLSSWLVSG